MPHLKQCSRSAAISFSPVGPYLAAGTVAGVIDMNFSTTSVIEVYDTNFTTADKNLHLAGGPINASERFQKLAWGSLGSDAETHQAGLIAGALADGNILVWDAATLLESLTAPEGQSVKSSKLAKHSGPVRGLQFNSLNSPYLLASGGADSEINIWNLTDFRKASSYPASKSGANGQSASAEITTLAWNHKADHILATGAAGGITVWDLKQQRPRSILRDDNRSAKRCSGVAWHPSVATQIVVAYEDDNNPVMQFWDLRQTVSYVHEFQGHTKGILGLSWCLQDPGLLLSTGKDSRTLLWEASSGHLLAETVSPAFNFDVQWSPTAAGVFATSSFGGGDGQDGQIALHSLAAFSQPPDYSNGYADQPAAPLARVPAWLKRPAAASFGFGGKLVTVANEKQKVGDHFVNSSRMTLSQVTTEQELVARSQKFEQAISGGDPANLEAFCESKALEGSPEEMETWQFLKIHFKEDPKRDLLARLGFADILPPEAADVTADVAAAAEQLENLGVPDQPQTLLPPEGDGVDFFENEDGGGFLEQTPSPKAVSKPSTPKSPAAVEQAGEREEEIQRALMVGNFASALDACLEAGRLADALVIGHMGQGQHLVRAEAEVMKRQPRPYMRLVKAVMQGDLLGLVKRQPLARWRETLALVASYGGADEWGPLADALARRLLAAGQPQPAALAWICAGNVDAAVHTWTQALSQKGLTLPGLQSLMEKAVVLGMGVRAEGTSPALADLLSQYAGILASQGCMGMALEYLEMVPDEAGGPTAILKDRIFHSGSPDVPAHAQAPPFPFLDQASHPTTPTPAQPQAPPATSDFYNQTAYRTSGAYGGTPHPAPAPAPTYSQPQLQPQYNDYYPRQAPYDYSQQGGYPVAGGSYQPAASAPPPPLQPSYPSGPQQASPTAFAQPTYATPHYDQPPPSYAATFQAPSQPQMASRPSQAGTPSNNTAPAAVDWSQSQQSSFDPAPQGFAAQPSQPSTLPPPNLFVPSRSSAQPTPVPQAQPPAFVPSSSAASKAQPQQAPGRVFAPPQSFQPSQSYASSRAGLQPQAPAAAPGTPPAPATPKGPPPNITIATADTSKVPADALSIVRSLKAVYDRCAAAAATAPGKRREMDDTAKRLGQLFWRLNSGDLSTRVKTSLMELCAALDAHDFATASQKQIALTSTDWDECSTFLTGLKRLIKAAQLLG